MTFFVVLYIIGILPIAVLGAKIVRWRLRASVRTRVWLKPDDYVICLLLGIFWPFGLPCLILYLVFIELVKIVELLDEGSLRD